MHFAYLWRRQRDEGRVEAAKDRPCVVLIVDDEAVPGRELVSVLPITHSPPKRPGDALELPPATKRRLGLDEARSWVVVTESDDFTHPGYDPRRTPDGRADYATVSGVQLRALLDAFGAHMDRDPPDPAARVSRDD